jgi:hypothetical protein
VRTRAERALGPLILAALLVLAGCQARAPADGKLTEAEIDKVRMQIAWCWTVDLGMAGIEKMSVEIKTELAPDGSVLSAEWQTPEEFRNNENYRLFAQSARDAVMNCSPLDFPPEEYKFWKRTVFHFNAKEMLGP